MKTIFFHLLICFSVFGFSQANDLETIYNEGIEAYKSENLKLFPASMQKAEELSFNHPTIVCDLAGAYAKNGNAKMAKEFAQKPF